MTAKIVVLNLKDYEKALSNAKEILLRKYGIEDVTIQIEVQ